MKTDIRQLIDLKKVDTLLEGFNKSTGFVTAILDLDGNVLSKSGWRPICTEFHRINPETSKRCTISDTMLANKMEKDENYHAYKCLNGLMDVAVPLEINGEHVANLFSGQFFFEKPDVAFFKKQAAAFGFDEKAYLDMLNKVPVVSEEKVNAAMDFLLDMTQFISDLAFQKLEQEKITQDLKDNEQKFKSVFESANAGKSITLPSGEINANEAFCKMLGFTQEELKNKKWQDITPEEDIPTIQKIIEGLKQGETDSARFEKRYICKNGSLIWTDVSVSILRDEYGQPLHFITTVIDITERKRAEKALRLSENRLNRALENIPDVVVIYDRDLKIQYINAATRRISGRPVSDFLGKREEEIWPPEVYQVYMPMLQESLDTGEVRSMDTELTFPNGDIRSLGITCVPLLDDKGAVKEVMGVTNDFTDRKKAEQALRESEEKFFTLFEKSPFAVTLSKLPDGRFVAVNEAFEKEFGFTKHEALGKNSKDLGINPDAEGRKQILEALKESNSVRNKEMILRSKWGEKCYYETNIDRVVINGEEYLLNTTQNISEYKRAENELKENYNLIRIAGEKAKLGGWNVILNENRSYWSDEVAAIHEMPTGYSPLLNEGINFYAPEWRDKIVEVYSKCAQEGIPYDEEMEIITATGKRVWVRTIGEAVKDENGNIFKIQGAFQDITLKKQAEKDLKASEDRYKAIFESTGTATITVDEDTTIVMANNECFEVFGYDLTHPSGQKWTQFVAPESVQEMLKNHQLRRKNPKLAPRKYEVKLLNSKDEKRDVVLNINMIPGTKQSVVSMLDITERKQAEEELQKTKSNLEEYFENDISANYVVSVSGEILSCNKTFLNLFGFEKKSDSEGFDITKLFNNPNDRKQMIRLVRKQKKVENYELELISKEGKIIYALINTLGIFDKDDNLDKIRGYVVDITQRKNIEKELQKREEEYRLFFENDITGNYHTTLDGKILTCNNTFVKILKYISKEEIYAINMSELYDGNSNRDKFINKLRTEKKLQNNTLTLKAHDGSEVEIIENVIGLFDDSGELKEIIGYMSDITLQKKLQDTQKMLLEISQLTTKHFTLTSFLAEVHQKIKQIVRANNFYVALYNESDNTYSFPYHVDEYDKVELNKPYDFSNGYTDYVFKSNQSLIVTPEYQLEVEKDGTISGYGEELSVWLGVPFKTTENSKPAGVMVIQDYQNLESYTETDKTIMEIIAQFIGSFIERIKYLEDLIQTKEKAEESDRLKSAFLANMSHEIRTPMNGILGFANLLLEPDLNSEEKESYIKIVNQSGQRLLNTVNDIIEIAKIEAGIVNVSVKEIDLNSSVEELIRFFKLEAEKKGLKLIVDNLLPVTEKNITTDRNKFDSILSNLIKNALKYTESGTINVGCRTNESVVEFYIKDTGIGIPKDRQKAVFERFVQSDIADSKAFEGSGLGLAISKSYVEMLGGNIWMESREGKGSTFYFTLPVKNNNEQKSTEHTEESTEKKRPGFKKLKILIAEDDETSRNYNSLIVNDFSAEILEAGTGIEAIELCRNNKDIDLILMDVKMPGMDGYESTRRIREFNKEVIIIAQTAYGLTGDREKSIESGCNDYIAKPVNKNGLHTLIQKYFGK